MPESVLVTGFPSFVARKMVEELVREPDVVVHAIVRTKSLEEARAALDVLPLAERRRVDVIEGDAAAIDLGLSGAEMRELLPKIDVIHHLAQVSYMGAEAELATHVNVGGAREILEIAALCPKLSCLVYHSTAQVSGDRTGLVLEDDLDKGQVFKNPVEETMARGERIVRSKMGKVPIAIVRPTIVVGDSKTGEVDRFDGPYFLILLLVTSPPDIPLPLPGRGDAPLNLVPVDYYVRAARAIGRDPRAPGRTFHVGDPAPITARRVFDLVAAAGGRRSTRGFIPANITKALLRTPGLDRVAKSPRAFLDALATPVTYSFAHTTELLAGTDIRCPPFESYVEGLVEYVQQRLREKRARDRSSGEIEDPLG
ncbi:MAG: SDR family oxidoreductase [Labilithrix sp.]|nr:SDR family oxidoreductase [Labilithrix sp.]MCW5817014.1 SDR family oxidoreductase [Labilithrix sp.]